MVGYMFHESNVTVIGELISYGRCIFGLMVKYYKNARQTDGNEKMNERPYGRRNIDPH